MSDFPDYLNDVFAKFGEVTCRKMFGGYGVYHRGLMFGLIADDVLYLKTDESSSKYFREQGLDQFIYKKSGKDVRMSYYQAPDEIYDDAAVAKVWASRAYASAQDAKQKGK